MAQDTGISWTDSTANLWIGCTKVSPACDHCYAEAEQDHRRHRVQWGPHGDRSYCKQGWADLRKWQRAAERNGGVDPKLGRRRRVFINSLSDIFDNHRSIDPWRADAFELLEQCTHLDIILVTKRLPNVEKLVPAAWLRGVSFSAVETGWGWPPHVWLITTIENRVEQIRRQQVLKALKRHYGIRVVGISAEPLIENLDWRELLDPWFSHCLRAEQDIAAASITKTFDLCRGCFQSYAPLPADCPAVFRSWLDWLIIGGESGRETREMDLAWPREALGFCAPLNTAFHFKQTTNKGPIPGDLMVREFPR